MAGKQNGNGKSVTAPAPMPVPLGRPTIYTPELAKRICERVMMGEAVGKICDDPEMPGRAAFYDWLNIHPEFSKQYARAKQIVAHGAVEELLDIADNGTNDWMKSNDPDNPGYLYNGEAIARSRIRIDTRKWIAAKLLPKVYGDVVRQEHTGADGGPIRFEMTPDQRAEVTAHLLSVKKVRPKADAA